MTTNRFDGNIGEGGERHSQDIVGGDCWIGLGAENRVKDKEPGEFWGKEKVNSDHS